MKKIEKLLPKAKTSCTSLLENNEIKSNIAGYINGFPALVIRNGLSTSFMLYMEGDKLRVLEQIGIVAGYTDIDALKRIILGSDNATLRLISYKLIDAAIAIKIMSRTFTIENN